MKTRKVTTFYEHAEGIERDITVEVEQQDRFTAIVLDDLEEMGVPEDERAGVRERAIEAFWEAEHRAWLMTPEAEERGQ